MKKYLIGILILLLLPLAVHAIGIGDKSMLDSISTQAGLGSVSEAEPLVGQVIKAILSVLGLIFLVLMVYAGMLWMTARGDEGKVEESRNIITAAVIGLAITVSAYAITIFVVGRFSGETVDTSTGINAGAK